MAMMADPKKALVPGSFTDSLVSLGRKYARELGIKPLGDGEDRPDSFYTTNHYTGTSARGDRAVVRIGPPDHVAEDTI